MEAKKLARMLVDRKLVERSVLEQVHSRLRLNETLADRLVSDGVMTEVDLLRTLAQESQTRFVSSPRLAELRVPPDVLEYIPADAAERFDVLPIAVDKEQRALALVIADPERVAELDKLPRVARMDQLAVNIALPGAIRAAIRRLYGRERILRPTPKPLGKCPQCAQPYFADQLECGGCGLLLNADAPVDRTNSRFMRALLSQPSGGKLRRKLNEDRGNENRTRRGFIVEVTDEQIPVLVAGLDIARSLAELEAFLVSFVDGVLTVGGLSHATGLMAVEVRSAVASLVERQVLRLATPAAYVVRGTGVVTDPAIVAPVEPIEPPHTDPRLQIGEAPAASPAPMYPSAGGLKIPKTSSEAQVDSALQSALALERIGRVAEAITTLRAAIARAPAPAPLYNRLALVVLNQQRDAKQAEELIRKAIEREPQNPVYQENLARLLSLQAVKGKLL